MDGWLRRVRERQTRAHSRGKESLLLFLCVESPKTIHNLRSLSLLSSSDLLFDFLEVCPNGWERQIGPTSILFNLSLLTFDSRRWWFALGFMAHCFNYRRCSCSLWRLMTFQRKNGKIDETKRKQIKNTGVMSLLLKGFLNWTKHPNCSPVCCQVNEQTIFGGAQNLEVKQPNYWEKGQKLISHSIIGIFH